MMMAVRRNISDGAKTPEKDLKQVMLITQIIIAQSCCKIDLI